MIDIKFKTLGINDKALFDRYFEKYKPEISEYTFTNLFVWRNSRNIQYAEFDEGLIILAMVDNESYFLPPVGYKNIPEIYENLMEFSINSSINPLIKRAPKYHMMALEGLGFQIIADRDNFDYIYRVEDLANLKGRKYDGKRGFIRKFSNKYEFDCLEYNETLKNDCLKLTKNWMSTKKEAFLNILEREFDAIEEFLQHYKELGSHGCIAKSEGKVIAFTFGEHLNPHTCVVHFEKANVKYEGIYQTINQQFTLRNILGKCEFINREQDMGIEGIRKAKESYKPAMMIEKFNVSAK